MLDSAQKFEWMTGPPPNRHFVLAGSPKATFLVIKGVFSQGKIACITNEGSGEIDGADTVANVAITFHGCEGSGVPCDYTENEERHEIRMSGLSGELGVDKAGETALKDEVGLTLAGSTKFFCGGSVVRVELSGSALDCCRRRLR